MSAVALMVAEKPSVAELIAQKLSTNGFKSRKSMNGIPVHEWHGRFRGQQVLYRMTAVTGHVFGMDFPSKYNSWEKVDPAELFDCPTQKTEANEKQRMPASLRSEAKHAQFLILWLDCDKEGENICFEIISILESCMDLRPMQTLFRARFSALTAPELKKAMDTLTYPKEEESLSVDARQELDLRIGCAFTRFQTKLFHGKYGSVDSSLVSYGPCQTPTLGFCVKRHDEIQTFKPEKHWTIHLSVCLEAEKVVRLDWKRKRLFDREAVEYIMSTIKENKTAFVSYVKKKEAVRKRPVGLNTVELLRMASSRLGMSPHHTMQVAERLYTSGFVSYPRTETTHYPDTFDHKDVLSKFSKHNEWSSYVNWDSIVKPLKGTDAGDHSPITPLVATSTATFHDLDSQRLYEFIVRYFISTFTEDCVFLETTIDFQVGSEQFTFNGKQMLIPGFSSVFPVSVVSSDDEIPEVREKTSYAITERKIYEGETKPPDYLTESELISLMEKHGIGTDASIPVHINNIVQRNYVKLVAGRKLEPTELGVILVHGYLKIDPELVLPTMRAEVETQLNLIAKGTAGPIPVVRHTLEIFKAKFIYFVKHISSMEDLFEVSFSAHAESGKPFSRCGKCRRYMKLVACNPSNKLHCGTCNETYNVPGNGALRPFNNTRCPLDDFEMIQWNGGSKGRSYLFCPYCFNNPPFMGMKKGSSGCNNCLHTSCPWSMYSKGICACEECSEGVLVLDSASGNKWKISCNKCDVFFSVFEGSRKVNVLEDNRCEECNALLLSVVLPKNEGDKEVSGCLFCTDTFEPFVEKHRVLITRRKNTSSRGRGRGRGRGKGRRGRGGR